MTDRSSYPPGVPCWADLGVPDLQRACDFYGALFGWDFDIGPESTGRYTYARLDGKPVAGLYPTEGSAGQPAWSTYLASPDVESTAQRFAAAGGRIVRGPFPVGPAGTVAHVVDPTGAAIGLWQGAQHLGAGVVDEPGTMCWHELNTRDGASADAFYAAVFGYEHAAVPADQAVDYTIFKLGADVVAGRMEMSEADWPAEIEAHWLLYFAVTDPDAAVARVSELGGGVGFGPAHLPLGRMAVVSDPFQTHFGILRRASLVD